MARSTLLLVSVLCVATLPALAGALTVVAQKGRAFETRQISIERGGMVRFSNEDEFSHQIFVQSPGFSYESDEQEPGHSVDVTFPKSGTFEVRCHIHPKMYLRVDVR